ncbi:MAG TPA: alpha/beta hydrolase [Steroidobacteraceae bacterium]|nr:alpha/beta hydrolase [Steroidobacteraceae bacterium]
MFTVLTATALAALAGTSSLAATLALHDCRIEHPLKLASIGARCARLAVAENPAAPSGTAIELAIAVVPALNRRAAAAPLFLLAGGPGQAATGLYASYAGAFARINRNHDIVLLDQRGTGRSAPLLCDYPEDWTANGEDLAALRRATLACLAKYGERVRFYTTSIAVRDLDEVRRALGYRQIDLYASSYGTRVAELYMRRHPESTHAVILDGVTYPEQAIGPDTPLDGEHALSLVLARCRAAADCARAYPDLARELNALRVRFGPAKSALTLADPTSAEPLEVEFDHGVLSAALRFLSYNASEASLLPTLIHQAASGSLAPLAAQAVMISREVSRELASGMQMSVVCSEDAPYFEVSAATLERIANTYQGSAQLDALTAICKLWPAGPVDADLHSALVSAVPSLLLSGEADPVTPPADAERLARGLERYRHLVLAGEGHGQVATGCVPKLMAEFLDSADPRSLDVACLERHRPVPFFVGFTGPSP